MQNHHVTQLDINLSSLKYNYHYLRNKTKAGTKTLAVVKAFAYGLEPVTIAKTLEKENVDYFGVAYLDEGVTLRQNGIKKPILVLHAQIVNYPTIIQYNLEPNIYSLHSLKAFLNFAKKEKLKNYPIHLKFNSGLNRLGFDFSEINEVVSLLKNNPYVKITSAMSHIAASEDLNEQDFTNNQIQVFYNIITELKHLLNYDFITHLSNTSGVINYPNAHLNMVRLGIGLYGFGNHKNETKKLKNVVTLKSIISQIRVIQKGESVSYNRDYIAQKEEKIAIIPIGHADGYSRPLGCGNGYVTIHGKKAYTTGNVCMDMILVNITDINCKEGDEVIIFNNQQTVEEFATICNTISYEILTAISQRIKRAFTS